MTQKKQQTEMLCWEDGGWGQLMGEPSRNSPGWPGEFLFKYKRSEDGAQSEDGGRLKPAAGPERRGELSRPWLSTPGTGQPSVRVLPEA